MADKKQKDELSMEDYFENGMLREEDNPRKLLKKHRFFRKRKPAQKKDGQSVNLKRILIIAGIAAAVVLIIWLSVLLIRRRNDGAGYAEKLSEGIGTPLNSAVSAAKAPHSDQSAYLALSNAIPTYDYCGASGKEVVVQGVHLPQWILFGDADGDTLTDVWFYRFSELERSPYGTERKAYLDPTQITMGAELEKVESQLGLTAYCVHYQNDHTQQREYRYCFEDAETGDLTAYVITCRMDAEGNLKEIFDRRVDFLSMLVKSTMN